jgi:hypothetical protein
MPLAVLGFWIATGLGGLYMLGFTLSHGRDRTGASRTHLSSTVVFSHMSFAVAGLAVWIGYMATRDQPWAWASLIVLVVVALLGGAMFVRWTLDRHGPGAEKRKAELAEQQIPSAAVHMHGFLAFVTIVLTLLAALEIGT